MTDLVMGVPDEFEYRGILYGIQHKGVVDIDMNEHWKPDPSDVLIATYPRTGKEPERVHRRLCDLMSL